VYVVHVGKMMHSATIWSEKPCGGQASNEPPHANMQPQSIVTMLINHSTSLQKCAIKIKTCTAFSSVALCL
jgi:hypothetical protein